MGGYFRLATARSTSGVGLLSTFTGWKNVNTTHLMDAFCATAPARWGISPETATCAPTGGRLPTGGSVTPRVGPTYLVVGDAAGSVNPFNGEGISLAYETGRLAADAVDLALRDRRPARARDLLRNGSTRCTASTSRSLVPSCARSATRR